MKRGERGLSLAEVLVALTVMVIAGTVALILYDASRKSFQRGENATEQQQAVRIAFDKLSSDLRLAGYDANPDGEPDFPDDAIEAAFDTAIVLRADYDAEDPAESAVPETALAGGAHRAVSVGNDEIVAYVLAKPDAPSPDTLTFDADVRDTPRDGVPEAVRIDRVALVQNDPPYTLYRVTLNNDGAAWGGSGFVVRTPLVENIRSLTFHYHAADGHELNPAFDPSTIADDIGGGDAPASRRLRASIRRVEIEIEGLTRDADRSWQDPLDTNPVTRSYRKFHLRGDVTPRNLGKKGLQDLGWDVTPPSVPAPPDVIAGHCRGLWVQWAPNPASDRVAAYKVRYTAVSATEQGQRTIGATSVYIDGLTEGRDYRVTVEAVDAAGNWTPPSGETTARTVNVNTPTAPVNIHVTADQPGRITVTWDAVTHNSSSDPTGDPDAPAIRDLAGYRVQRGLAEDFHYDPAHPGDPLATLVADETFLRPAPSPKVIDRQVVACRTYYYRVISTDACNANDFLGYETSGSAVAPAPPSPPTGVVAVRSGSDVRVSWEPPGRDALGNSAYVDNYQVLRQVLGAGETPPGCPVDVIGTATRETTFLDDLVPAVPSGGSVVYAVQALNDCSSNNVSDCSAQATPTCSFTGQVEVTTPRTGYVVPPLPIVVRIGGGLDTYTGATLSILREEDGQVEDVSLAGPGPQWSHTWTQSTPGTYLIRARVTNTGPCFGFNAVRVRVGS